MEVVSAALQYHVDYRSAVAAEFGGIAVVLHLKLLHDLNGRLVVHVAGRAFSLFRSAHECAINPHLRGRIALPVGDKIGTR